MRIPIVVTADTRKLDRVDHDRVPGTERADEGAAEARTSNLPERLARTELPVRIDEVLGLDEHRQIALVRDVEEDGEHASDDRDDEELRQVEHAERVGDRDRADDRHAPDVRPDEHGPAAPPVDPRAGGQRDQQEGELRARGERADFERRRVEGDDREERDGQLGDRATDLADRLASPQQDEVPVLENGGLLRRRSLLLLLGHPVWLPK